jgi:hypothetical protein
LKFWNVKIKFNMRDKEKDRWYFVDQGNERILSPSLEHDISLSLFLVPYMQGGLLDFGGLKEKVWFRA